jgi:hypothetical protein
VISNPAMKLDSRDEAAPSSTVCLDRPRERHCAIPSAISQAAPRYFTSENALPIVSTSSASPKTASSTNSRSPTTIPAAADAPCPNPPAAERADTASTLVLGTAASTSIAANKALALMSVMALHSSLCSRLTYTP